MNKASVIIDQLNPTHYGTAQEERVRDFKINEGTTGKSGNED